MIIKSVTFFSLNEMETKRKMDKVISNQSFECCVETQCQKKSHETNIELKWSSISGAAQSETRGLAV